MNNEESNIDYELTILLNVRSDYHEEMDALEKEIKELGGSIEKTEYDGVKMLAYKINEQDKARYCYLDIKISEEKRPELNMWLNYNDNVLRFLLIKATPRRTYGDD